MKTFRNCKNIYLVFTGKEADENIYELFLLGIEENKNSESAKLITNEGKIVIDQKLLDTAEIHYDTGGHLFADKTAAENWHKVNQ